MTKPGRNGPLLLSEVADMSNHGIVIYREDQLNNRDYVFNGNGNNDLFLMKNRYAVMDEDTWPDGSPIVHCKHCKMCLRILRSVNKKLYHLGYWCSCFQSRVEANGNCRNGSEKTQTMTIVLGDQINKLFDRDSYFAAKANEVKEYELSTSSVDKSVKSCEQDINKLSTEKSDGIQDVVEDGKGKPQDIVENQNEQL